jgi:amino acid adenylation domain-containing protein/non-ribosomal peptide synthase protein (TIGR01720 family)
VTCIHHLIEEQAAQKPTANAVQFGDQRLSYRDLDSRANRVAHHLCAQGVGPGDLVGICLERSAELVVAVVGVLKSGAAYVPLDPIYPQERLAFVLAETQAPVLLTQQYLAGRLPHHPGQVICLDTDWPTIAQQSDQKPAGDATAEDLVYVIYTSGSTGKPKGVQIAHSNLINSTQARLDYYPEPVSSFLLLSSFAFDSSIVGIFGTLCQGGTLILPAPGDEQDVQKLAGLIHRHQVTDTLCLPSVYNLILTYAQAHQLDSLKTVIVAGEACPQDVVQRHYQRLPQTALYNEYGPTEATVWSTVYRVPATGVETPVPIGRPIANTHALILDRHRQPVPIGVPGELYIGGDGLARGYLNRPALTAERFTANPFGQGHLYKTGDLARYRADGNIEFLGRIDHQVKIRGYRIEMGEIEATLSQHPAVRQAVVVVYTPANQPDSAPKRLVAYVEPIDGQTGSAGEFRRFLLDKLPDYMVPAAFVLLDTLPTTPNGKIDRRKLPAPDSDSVPAPETAFVAPRTPVEEKLATIWAGVLSVESVGIHDNFFELGGDSILSIQIIAKAAQQNIKLKPNDIFQHPSVAALAGVAEVGGSEIDVKQTAVTGPVQLTPIQHWFFEQGLTTPHHWNQSYLLELRPDADLALIEHSLQQLFLHHDALRLRFSRTQAGWTQENAGPEQSMRVARFDLSNLPEPEQQGALAAEATKLQQSLDLASGGLAQAAIFELGPGQPARLLLVIHHLVVDGLSWQILLEDLENAYQQVQRGQPVQLPPKTTSFQQWGERLTAFAQSAELQQDLDFWLEDSSPSNPPLSPDFSSGDTAQNTAGSAATVSVTLTADETKALLQQVPAAYQTQINDALLTALLLTFAQRTSTNELFFDLEGHGREALSEEVDLSRTVGWFTTVSPLCLSLAEGASVGQVLISVKEQLRRMPRKGLSYGLLRYLSQDSAVRERLARRAQPEITFNYMGQFDQTLSDFSLFQAAPEPVGPERSPHDQRRYLLDINSMVEQGQLTVKWSYSKSCFRPETIENLADSFIQNLRTIIEHCTAPGAGGYTPSDFPEANLDQSALDDLLAEFSEVVE